jgi:sugar phosphate isomerase/epimerase
MRLAYSTLACPAWTVEAAAEAVRRYGYDGIEWRLADGEPISPQTPAPVLRRLVAATRDYGLVVVGLDSSCRLVQPTASGAEVTAAEARFMIDLAVGLGAPAIRVFGGALANDQSVDDALPQAADLLRRLASYGTMREVAVLVETHDEAWSHSPHMAALIAAAAQPTAGVLYDVLHPYRAHESPGETLVQLGTSVRLVHLKDAHRLASDPNRWELCMIGEGDLPLARVLKELRQRGYNGWYSFEWERHWHPELAEAEVVLPAASKALRALARENSDNQG